MTRNSANEDEMHRRPPKFRTLMYIRDVTSFPFSLVARGRSLFYLNVQECTLVKLRKPIPCRRKERLCTLGIFHWCYVFSFSVINNRICIRLLLFCTVAAVPDSLIVVCFSILTSHRLNISTISNFIHLITDVRYWSVEKFLVKKLKIWTYWFVLFSSSAPWMTC